MNDLLFYTILIALLYYFFIYLPAQKKLSSASNQPPTLPSPFMNTQATQTETIIRNEEPEIKELAENIDNLLKNLQEFKQELE